MASTSKVHDKFVKEPLDDNQLVTAMAGIGPALKKKLMNEMADKAYAVLGKYIALGRNNELFVSWLKDKIGASDRQAKECQYCLEEWCNQHLLPLVLKPDEMTVKY